MTISPPAIGPAIEATTPTALQIPNARPRRPAAKIVAMIGSACGVRSAPPAPWTTRAAMSCSGFWASPQAADARVNVATPATNAVRGPNRSPIRLALMSSTAKTSV